MTVGRRSLKRSFRSSGRSRGEVSLAYSLTLGIKKNVSGKAGREEPLGT
jgi:hypothetical protein